MDLHNHNHQTMNPFRAFLTQEYKSCFLELLNNYFTLQELIKLRAISRQWKQVIEKDICAQKWSLRLFGSVVDVEDYQQDLDIMNLHDDDNFGYDLKKVNDILIFPGGGYLEARGMPIKFLLRLFPNLSKLSVSCQVWYLQGS